MLGKCLFIYMGCENVCENALNGNVFAWEKNLMAKDSKEEGGEERCAKKKTRITIHRKNPVNPFFISFPCSSFFFWLETPRNIY